jgi:hypothetical protein
MCLGVTFSTNVCILTVRYKGHAPHVKYIHWERDLFKWFFSWPQLNPAVALQQESWHIKGVFTKQMIFVSYDTFRHRLDQSYMASYDSKSSSLNFWLGPGPDPALFEIMLLAKGVTEQPMYSAKQSSSPGIKYWPCTSLPMGYTDVARVSLLTLGYTYHPDRLRSKK